MKKIFFLTFLLISTSVLSSEDDRDLSNCLENTKYSSTYGLGIQPEDLDYVKYIDVCNRALEKYPENLDVIFGITRLNASYSKTPGDDYSIIANLKLKHLVSKKYPEALTFYAEIFYFGSLGSNNASSSQKGKVSYEESLKLLLEAFELGSSRAGLNLYHHFKDGKGTKADQQKAWYYLNEAAERGYSNAKLLLAELLLSSKNPSAKSLIIEEMERKNPAAYLVYSIYKFWFPEDKSDLIAVNEEFRRFSENGNPRATAHLALMNLGKSSGWFKDIGSSFGFENDQLLGLESLAILSGSTRGLNYLIWLLNQFSNESFSKEDTEDIERYRKALNQLNDSLIEIAEDSKEEWATYSSIQAYRALSKISESGIFNPVNKKDAINYCRLAADRYGDPWCGISAGWLIYMSPDNYDFDEAIRLTRIGTKSEKLNIKANAYNNLGVFYHYSSYEDSEELAIENYKIAADLFLRSGLRGEFAFDNLARYYLLGTKTDIKEAEKWARISDDNDGSGFFTYMLDNFPFTESTTTEKKKEWLEEVSKERDRHKETFIELMFFSEKHDNSSEVIKWATLCTLLCAADERNLALERLPKYRSLFTGPSISNGERIASEWIISNLSKTLQPDKVTNNELSIKETTLKHNGNFYALLIGINRYNNFPTLKSPIYDINAIGDILSKKYGAKVSYLKNATRSDITISLNNLKKNIKSDDSLLIYYAGHGYLDEQVEEGYWLPSNASQDDDTHWVANSYVINKIKSLRAKNILLIADSCFSGSIITRGISILSHEKEKSIFEKYLNTASRIAITSGGLQPVIDGVGGNHSIFAKSLLEALESNAGLVSSMELYLGLRDKVKKEALKLGVNQTPFFGELIAAGHDGPDFIFIPK